MCSKINFQYKKKKKCSACKAKFPQNIYTKIDSKFCNKYDFSCCLKVDNIDTFLKSYGSLLNSLGPAKVIRCLVNSKRHLQTLKFSDCLVCLPVIKLF